MTLYVPPSIGYVPGKVVFSTWVDHIPFGYDLVAALRPSLLVELGSHYGMSFFTFCQSIRDHHVDGLAYAVDTWEGDDHTGPYGEDVFSGVQQHLRDEYRGFSYQLRMTFTEAREQFAEESVDLLHIDGFHTYEAVAGDFETWYPKVAPGGIVLFHDVRARLEDFGVWRFWDEAERNHQTFTFNHGFGLGVLRKPGGDRHADAPLLQLLFSDDEADHEALRTLYVSLGELSQLRRQERMRRRRKEQAAAERAAEPST
ncbi:MAG: class I SAM-dependent methyltransferase [Acidimicrobiia bacterium]|nr:class I SAM-dependent methyltransferase [Acidimicrobiia bacterium]